MAVQINVAANQAALVQSIQAGVQAYNQRFANQNQVNLQVNARAFSQPLGRITGDVKDFEAALAASNARVIAFGASTAILGGVLRGFKSIAEVTVEVEKNLADINRVFGLTTKELQKFSTDLFNVSKQTASSFGDASKAALEFSRQGVKAEEVLQRTADAMTLARLAGMNVNNAIEALTATVNGFQATGITTTQVLNKLVAVEQSYAVSAGDLAEALSRTGLAAQEAGVNIDQLNALVTAAQEKTARGGAVIGNALKTIFTRLQRTETLDQLEAFNIGVRDIQGNILPAVQILQNFASAYNTLADSQRSQLSEQVAGVYQVNILKAIISDLNNKQGAYAGALQKGATATNEAQVAAAKLNQTLDALLSQTSTVAQQFANNVGKVTFEPLAKYTAESFKSLFENLNEILEGEGVGSTFANGLLKGIRNVLAGPGAIGAFFVLFKLIQNSFTYLSQALPQIVGITTETQNRKNIEQAILQIMQQQGPVAQALAGQMGNQTAQAQLLLQLARQQTAEYQRQQALVAALAPALSAQGVSARGQQGLRVTRSGGYIPKEAKLQETIGALAGGYTPGQVIKSPVGGVMNSAEQVKYMPGFAQPFINPPANSDAGRTHRRNSINKTGVDPYMNNGFIPNFYISSTDKKRVQSAKIIEGNLFEKELYTKLDTGTEPPGSTLDFPTGKLESVRSKNRQTTLSVGIDDQTLYGDAKLSLNSSNITSMISKYIRAGNKFIIGDTVFDDKNYSILYKYGPPDNLLTNKTRKLSSLLKHNPSLIHNIGHRLIDMRTGNRLNKAGENTKIGLTFFGDKVDIGQTSASGFIPNLASSQLPVEYRNPITGKLNNPKIAAAIRMGKLDPAVAMAAGYKTSSQSIQERKQGVLERVLSSGFKRIGISGIGTLPSNTTFSKTNPFAKNFESLALKKAQQMFGSNNIVFASNYEKGGRKFKGAPTNTAIDALEDNLTGPVIEMKSGDTTPDAALRKKFTQGKNELIEMWHNAMPDKKIDSIVQSIGARPEYLFYNADKEVKRGTEQILQANKGFIPNFAADYINQVMNLESNMSGNKAVLDTQSGPFPFIRNSSQPNFAAAISDHGGLNNALSDSIKNQKDAGLMNKGFVPNFAGMRKYQRQRARNQSRTQQTNVNVDDLESKVESIYEAVKNDFDKAFQFLKIFAINFKLDIEDFSKNSKTVLSNSTSKAKTAMQNLSTNVVDFGKKLNTDKFKERLDKFTNTAMFAVPMIAAQFEQGLYGNKERTDLSATERMGKSFLSTGLTSISTGASIGNMIFPGLGGAVGAAVGGLVAFTSSLSAATLSADELMQLNEKQTQKAQESIQSASSYIDAQKNLTDMIAKGASSTEIENATKKLSDNFSQIKDVKLQDAFIAAGGDVTEMIKKLQQYTTEVAKQSAKRTGMYGPKTLTSKERAGALAMGFGADAKTYSKQVRDAIKEAQKAGSVARENARTAGLGYERGMRPTSASGEYEKAYNKSLMAFAEKMVPQDEKDRASAVQTYYESLLDKPLEVLDILDKDAQRLDLSKYIQNYRNKATESVASIFQKIQDSLEQAAFEAAMSFEKQSSAQRIQSIISDFTSSLNEQISSYMMSNLPEIKKFEYANIAAKTKAEDSLVKLNDDYAAFQIQQDKEKSKFLQRNAEELTKVFKDSMLTSQENAQFFRDKVFNQLQSGKYNEINVGNVAKEIQTERTKQFNDLIKSNTLGLPATLDLTKSQDVEGFRNATTAAMEAKAAMAPEEEREKIVNEFTLILDALNNALKASEFAKNQFAKDEIARAIAERERNKTSLELEQQNAEKELQIKQDLNRLKIAAELQYSVESNRIQKENFTRIKEAEITAKNLGFAIDIAKANSESYIAALRRGLEDPRQEYGMGVRESLERRIGIENKVLEEQRRMEDQNLATEMAQAQLQLAAEIQNTNALEKLTQVMNQWITDRLAEDLGGVGSEKMQKIQSASNEMGASAENDIDTLYGKGTYIKYQTYLAAQKNQSSLGSAGALGANAPVLDFTQLSELAKGNPVLESQVELLKKQYETREKILGIQRQTVDEDIRIKQENERLNTTIMGRLEKGFGNMAKQSDQIILDLAERAPSAFADGMTNALMEVAKGTKSIGDALQDMVINFGQMLMQEVMRAAMYRAIGSIGSGLFQNGGIVGKQRGGIIRAENGTYIPGNRTGDRNLALLEDGEYVLNREAVAAIGVNNLDGLNYGMAPRFQSGGGFNMQAEQKLIDDKFEYTGNLLQDRRAAQTINSGDYSAYAYSNDPYFTEMKQKAYEDFKRREMEDYQRKVKRAQMIGAIVGAVGSMALGAGLGGLGQGTSGVSKAIGPSTRQLGQLKNAGVTMGPIGSNGISLPNMQTGGIVRGFQSGGLVGYQSGGFIPYGARLTDTLPRYMSGGTVMNNPSIRRYAAGGAHGMFSSGTSSNNMSTYNNSQNNATNIYITSNNEGMNVNSQTSSYKPNDIKLTKEMALQISKIAKATYMDGMRTNGELSRKQTT